MDNIKKNLLKKFSNFLIILKVKMLLISIALKLESKISTFKMTEAYARRFIYEMESLLDENKGMLKDCQKILEYLYVHLDVGILASIARCSFVSKKLILSIISDEKNLYSGVDFQILHNDICDEEILVSLSKNYANNVSVLIEVIGHEKCPSYLKAKIWKDSPAAKAGTASKIELLDFLSNNFRNDGEVFTYNLHADEEIIKIIWERSRKDLSTQISMLRHWRCPDDVKEEILKLSPGIENRQGDEC